ncbi:MAG TPA: CBS domain-containing protein [Acidimicrobiales bacterium]|jgi:CBS domain-containing protein|nr:CBS domain-containing protein [Acidimicrobiales bacterium]
MRTVRDVMSGHIEVLRTSETAADAASYLASHVEESVPLCLSDGSLAGTVSNRDIVSKVVAKGLDPREVRLEELAEPGDVIALDVDLTVEDAVAYMCRHHRSRLPVTDGNRVVGHVTQRDVARSVSFRPPWLES